MYQTCKHLPLWNLSRDIKKNQRIYSHGVERRWGIAATAESLSWFPGLCISRNATASKSGSHCGLAITDRKREKGQQIWEKLLSSSYMGGSFGSFCQIDQEESNLMYSRWWIKATIMVVPLPHAETSPKMKCADVRTGNELLGIFAMQSSALSILHVLSHLILSITTWWDKH